MGTGQYDYQILQALNEVNAHLDKFEDYFLLLQKSLKSIAFILVIFLGMFLFFHLMRMVIRNS